MSKTIKPMKQLTFDSLSATATNQNKKTSLVAQKQIYITKMETITGIDELILKTSFRLEPSYRAFSKIKADLFFEDTSISTVFIQVIQGSLGTNELEYSWIMDTKGIAEGTYHLKVEMYEVWSSGEKLCQTNREATVNYVPQTRQARLIKIPLVKSVTRTDITIISNQEKQLYSNIEKAAKKEQSAFGAN
ncbi:MAG: hypothetical protein FWC33_05415 [Candidatus Bathyarchaeota archaeon]|nr:hypothetical protein [Candidatus Termiticorpusculum sp.]